MIGPTAHPETGEPGFSLFFVPTDGDGALHTFELRVWHDLTIDGAVDSSGEPTVVRTLDMANSETAGRYVECGMSGIPTLAFFLLDPYALPFDSPIELAVEITNADGLPSEIVVIDGCTPTVDADPGCVAP